MIHLLNISKGFGKQDLFQNLTFHVGLSDRIGLVGPNGTGKTTLFRIMLGETSVDSGTITKKKNLKTGYLPQEMMVLSGEDVLHCVLSSVKGYFETIDEKERIEQELQQLDKSVLYQTQEKNELAEKLVLKLADVEEKLLSLGGENLKIEAMENLSGLGFSESDMCRPLRTFSGGWHMRIMLARILINKPDLLLLDEPTNHLDLESIIWFEKYLEKFRGSIVLIAHDREFINRTVNKIVEIKPDGLREYPGNYNRYIELKHEEEKISEKRYYEQQAEIRRIEEFIARNRVRKDRAAQVQSRFKMLEKMEKLTLPVQTHQIRIKFKEPPRSTSLVIELASISKIYGDKTVFDECNLSIYRGEKIALVGLNGAGKTTLLKILAGVIDSDKGIRTLGGNVSVDYFAQHQIEALNPNRTVLEEMYAVSDSDTFPLVRGILGAFLFSGDEVEKGVSVLSGGEKSRLALAKIMLKPANFLVMDEPTNHLDIASREILEQALKQYDGTLCFTSHDRRFINAVASKVIEIEQGCLSHYPGNYEYYFYKKTKDRIETKSNLKKFVNNQDSEITNDNQSAITEEKLVADRKKMRQIEAEKRNLLYKKLLPLKEKLQIIEEAIAISENELKEMEIRLADPELYKDGDRTKNRVTEYNQIKERLKDYYDRWESLSRKINAIEEEEFLKWDK